MSQSSDMFPTPLCLKGMWSQRGHRLGSTHSGGSELSDCAGDMREEGGSATECVREMRERKWEGWEYRMPKICHRQLWKLNTCWNAGIKYQLKTPSYQCL